VVFWLLHVWSFDYYMYLKFSFTVTVRYCCGQIFSPCNIEPIGGTVIPFIKISYSWQKGSLSNLVLWVIDNNPLKYMKNVHYCKKYLSVTKDTQLLWLLTITSFLKCVPKIQSYFSLSHFQIDIVVMTRTHFAGSGSNDPLTFYIAEWYTLSEYGNKTKF
jgi:hypothetical protein